jgi:lipoxygenase homology domain-containing protein 1
LTPLGLSLQVTVGTDGSGRAPAWHLDHLVVTAASGDATYVFACRCGDRGLQCGLHS